MGVTDSGDSREKGGRLVAEELEDLRLLGAELLQHAVHDRLLLDELLDPEADAGEHREAAVVELDDLLALVLLGRELVLGPGGRALDVGVGAGHGALLHLEVRGLPARERRGLDGGDAREDRREDDRSDKSSGWKYNYW